MKKATEIIDERQLVDELHRNWKTRGYTDGGIARNNAENNSLQNQRKLPSQRLQSAFQVERDNTDNTLSRLQTLSCERG